MDDEEAELRNPFPSPPSHYQNYTAHNIRLLSLLKERTAESGDSEKDQRELLSDQEDVPEWPLKQLEKPRADWILEDGEYTVFGDTWQVKEKIPSLGELGGQQLYPEDPTLDRRSALQSILRSMLVTYSHLLKALLLPPPNPHSEDPPEWRKYVEWLTVMSQNIMSAANDLRPVQARCNLEAMMTRQLRLRRSETATIHQKCDQLQERLAQLRQSAAKIQNKNVESSDGVGKEARPVQEASLPTLTSEDLCRWAEEL